VCFYNLQEEYEQLSSKIQNAAQKSIPCQLMGEFAVFSQTQARNHPTIIKVTLTFIEGNRNLFGSEIRISNINDFVHTFSIKKKDNVNQCPGTLVKQTKKVRFY